MTRSTRQISASILCAFGLFAAPAFAAGDALIVGNAQYSTLDTVFGAARVSEASAKLRDLGLDVTETLDADTATLQTAFAAFLSGVEPGDAPVIAVLSGAFVHGAGGAYLLPVDRDAPDVASVLTGALSVDAVLTVLAQHPGRALLVLGESGAVDGLDPYLQSGPGTLMIPQGVAVLRGPASDVAQFAASDLVRPGRRLGGAARRWELTYEGYAPDGLVMIRRGDVAQTTPEAAPNAADRAAWDQAQQRNTPDSYQAYLDAYPAGLQASAARQRLAALTEDPFYRERSAEEALALSRDARRKLQRDLSLLGYNTRGIDGIFGRGTRGAILQWQMTSGLRQSGFVDADQIARLDTQARTRAAELEEQARIERAAQEKRDRLAWDGVTGPNDETGLRAYLDSFPDGLFAARAVELLRVIDDRRAARAADRDRRAWTQAEGAGTQAAYRNYLADNPQGAFRGDAQARIDRLTRDVEAERLRARAQQAEERLGLNSGARRLAEARLNQMGLNPGNVDGRFDANTRRAIRQYQKVRGLRVTGFLDQDTVVRLLADGILGR